MTTTTTTTTKRTATKTAAKPAAKKRVTPLNTKKAIREFLTTLETKGLPYDEQGQKFYIMFADSERNGDWTLMYYPATEQFSLHGKGADYCDENETIIELDELVDFVYKARSDFRAAAKSFL